MDRKPIIYQLFPRLFTNTNVNCVPHGTIAQTGVGKMNDITDAVLGLGQLFPVFTESFCIFPSKCSPRKSA